MGLSPLSFLRMLSSCFPFVPQPPSPPPWSPPPPPPPPPSETSKNVREKPSQPRSVGAWLDLHARLWAAWWYAPSDHLGSFCHFPPLCLPLHSGCLAHRSPRHPQSLLPTSACLLVPALSPALPDPWSSPPRPGPQLPLTWLTAPPCPFLLWRFHPYLSIPPTFPPPFPSLPSFSPSSPSLWVFLFPLFIPSSLLLYNLQGRLGTPGIFPGLLVGRLLPSPEPQATFRAGSRCHREHLSWCREPKSPEWRRVLGALTSQPPYPILWLRPRDKAAQPIVFLVGLSHCDSLENTGG